MTVLYIISFLIIAFVIKTNLERKRGYIIPNGIDLQVEILPVPFDELASMPAGEPSAAIRARVVKARAVQERRFAGEKHVHCNAQMNSRLMTQHCALGPEAMSVLRTAMTRYDMSARAYDRILKVARTIADLEGSAEIQPHHMSEAVSYRNLDRSSWGATTQKLPF